MKTGKVLKVSALIGLIILGMGTASGNEEIGDDAFVELFLSEHSDPLYDTGIEEIEDALALFFSQYLNGDTESVGIFNIDRGKWWSSPSFDMGIVLTGRPSRLFKKCKLNLFFPGKKSKTYYEDERFFFLEREVSLMCPEGTLGGEEMNHTFSYSSKRKYFSPNTYLGLSSNVSKKEKHFFPKIVKLEGFNEIKNQQFRRALTNALEKVDEVVETTIPIRHLSWSKMNYSFNMVVRIGDEFGPLMCKLWYYNDKNKDILIDNRWRINLNCLNSNTGEERISDVFPPEVLGFNDPNSDKQIIR